MNDDPASFGFRFMRRFFGLSRWFVLIAVVASTLAAIALTVYGGLAVASNIIQVSTSIEIGSTTKKEVETYALEFISLIDIFLLSTVLYLVGIGLYELFIDPNVPAPDWMRIGSLDDLKDKLTGVVVVLIGVDFLGDFVESEGNIDILWSGLGGAAMVLALSIGLGWVTNHRHNAQGNHLPKNDDGTHDGGS